MFAHLLAAAAAVSVAPNVLFITVDTLRADRCSSYGHTRPTTPALERLAREGAQFDTVYAPVPQTSPSHSTMFTGLYPITHGVVKNGIPLADKHRTLAEVMRERGYQTHAITSSPVFSRFGGFEQGFETFDNDCMRDGTRVEEGLHRRMERMATRITELATAWIKGRDTQRPFFLWTHYFSPHYPYQPPEAQRKIFTAPADASEHERLMALYEGEVAYSDLEIGRLLDALEAAGLTKDTLVVLTADHGEGVKQRGVLQHGEQITEEQVRVPLVFRWPGHIPKGRRHAASVELVDVMPTLMELLKVADAPPAQGRSLVPILSGDANGDPERKVYLQRRPYNWIGGRIEGEQWMDPGIRPKGPSFGLRAGRWKYIEAPEENLVQLFDLEKDPLELENLAAKHPDRARAMSLAIVQWREKYERDFKAPPIPKEELEMLRGLGYVN
jgi:arylsulfatase A-like enzyme